VAPARNHIVYQRVQTNELIVEDDNYEEMATPGSMDLSIHNRKLFLSFFSATQVPGVIAIILMLVWTIHYREGFSWGEADPGHAFNWHPLLMTIGMVYLYGNGALIYRVLPPVNQEMKKKLKIAHAVTMGVVFILMVIALKAAFDSHNYATPPITNMYTLHSWVGLTAALLFSAQWLSGLLVFLFPVAGPNMRAKLLPFHQYYGSAIFALVVAAALLGLLEKAMFLGIPKYKEKSGEQLMMNIMGMFIIAFSAGVTFMLSKFTKEKPV